VSTEILVVANRTAATPALLDLPSKASALGLPVTHVEARERERALAAK
jgi:hypothetical protein